METALGILIVSIIYLVLYGAPFMIGYEQAQWKPILKIIIGFCVIITLIVFLDESLFHVALYLMSFALMLFVGLPLTGIIFGTIAAKTTQRMSNTKIKTALNTAIFFLPKILLFSGLAALQLN